MFALIKVNLHCLLFSGLFALLLPSTAAFAALEQKNIDAALKRTEEIIESNIKSKRIPGCAMAVVYRNEVIFIRGYGSRTMGLEEPIDADTAFQLGSVSKPVAATLAVILESKGILNLDNPVSVYLPDFTLNSKQSQNALRVVNLLSHTSGVDRGGFNNMIESYASHAELVEALQKKRVTHRAGVHYDYNNVMYALIADVIEAATKQKFSTALSNNLLIPLNMTHTTTTLEGLTSTPNCARPHSRNQSGALSPCPTYSKGYYEVAPAGGINSSAHDMANFLKAQMGGYPKVLTPAAINRMQTPYVTTNNLLGGTPGVKHPHYGLGWRIVEYDGEPLVFHGGWLRGFTNFVGFLPREQLGIVILHNGDTKFSSKTAMKFFEIAKGLPETPDVPTTTKKGKRKAKAKAKPKTSVKASAVKPSKKAVTKAKKKSKKKKK